MVTGGDNLVAVYRVREWVDEGHCQYDVERGVGGGNQAKLPVNKHTAIVMKRRIGGKNWACVIGRQMYEFCPASIQRRISHQLLACEVSMVLILLSRWISWA